MNTLQKWLNKESKRLKNVNCENAQARLGELMWLMDELIGNTEADVKTKTADRILELEDQLAGKIVDYENARTNEDFGIQTTTESENITEECDLIECRLNLLKQIIPQMKRA